MQMKQDVSTRNLEEYPDVFADISNVNLYDGEQVILPEQLELLPSNLSYRDIEGESRELRPDIRMKVRESGMEISVMCIENQAGICNTMPVRDMGYQYASYQEQIRKIKDANNRDGKNYFTKEIGDEQRLIPVISMILYFGKEKWTKPLSLLDMLDIPDEKRKIVEPLIQNHSIRVIHLGEQDKLTRRKYRSDFRYVVEYLACQGDAEQFQQFIAEEGEELTHPEEVFDVMGALTSDKHYQQVKEEIKKNMEKGEKINMCYFVEAMQNIGMEKCRNALNTLIERLVADGRTDELLQSTRDRELQKKLMNEYGIQELDT